MFSFTQKYSFVQGRVNNKNKVTWKVMRLILNLQLTLSLKIKLFFQIIIKRNKNFHYLFVSLELSF